jgi:histidine triad (HIT) family protein
MKRLFPLLLLFLTPVRAETPHAPCVFCEIVAGRAPASVVYRDDRVMAFMDQAPYNPGHLLVIPLVHADSFLETPADTFAAMARVAHRLATALKASGIRCEGVQLRMNAGKVTGQILFHAHLHVIPRYEGDIRAHSLDNIAAREDLDATAEKVRRALAALPKD